MNAEFFSRFCPISIYAFQDVRNIFFLKYAYSLFKRHVLNSIFTDIIGKLLPKNGVAFDYNQLIDFVNKSLNFPDISTITDIEKEDYFWNNLGNNIRAARIGYNRARTEYKLEYRLSFWDRFLKPALVGFSFSVLLFAGYIYYDLTSGGFWNSANVRIAVEDSEFYFNEHSMLENGSIFSQGELTPMLVSLEENENR